MHLQMTNILNVIAVKVNYPHVELFININLCYNTTYGGTTK